MRLTSDLLFNITSDSSDANEFCLKTLILIIFNGEMGFIANRVEALQNPDLIFKMNRTRTSSAAFSKYGAHK